LSGKPLEDMQTTWFGRSPEGAADFERKIAWRHADDEIWEVAGRSVRLKADDGAQTTGILRLSEGALKNVKDVY
jgi:hypothetical protein